MHWIDFLGVAVFAATGVLSAGHKRLDLIGVIVIAMATALGGGTLRDLFLGREVFWTQDASYLWVILATVAIVMSYTHFWEPPVMTLLIADAFGLALFSLRGAQIAEEFHLAAIIIVLMGTITGVAGGLIRDVLLVELPLIFRQVGLYATCAVAGVSVYLLLKEMGVPTSAAGWVGMATILVLRLLGIFRNWTLPVYHISQTGEKSPTGKSAASKDV